MPSYQNRKISTYGNKFTGRNGRIHRDSRRKKNVGFAMSISGTIISVSNII
jgi:hypothetical protein